MDRGKLKSTLRRVAYGALALVLALAAVAVFKHAAVGYQDFLDTKVSDATVGDIQATKSFLLLEAGAALACLVGTALAVAAFKKKE
jgi:hypothetical protein